MEFFFCLIRIELNINLIVESSYFRMISSKEIDVFWDLKKDEHNQADLCSLLFMLIICNS